MTVNGRILKSTGGNYEVMYEQHGERLTRLCTALGIFRREGITPTAGDIVDIELNRDDKDKASIIAIHDRKSCLIRPAIANLDRLFIVIAPVNPPPLLSTVDKLTAIAVHNKIDPVIIINKSDMDEGGELRDIYTKAGLKVINASAKQNRGLNEIFILLTGCLSAFAGASGVGKSSLLNALFPELELAVNTISRKIERGRHTTRCVQLFEHKYGGLIADTPGFSVLDFVRFDFFAAEDCAPAFIEIYAHTGNCKYKDCSHTKEDGCSVLDALAQGAIAPSRHESYVELYRQLSKKNPWDRKQDDRK